MILLLSRLLKKFLLWELKKLAPVLFSIHGSTLHSEDFLMGLKEELSSVNQILHWFILSSVSSTLQPHPAHTRFRSLLF